MSVEMAAKYERLRSLLRELESVVVAFSAGVDSTLLVKVAYEVLGARALAVSGISRSFPDQEAVEARKLAKVIGVELQEIDTDEMADESYLQNGPDRCFHCKSELFGKLVCLARHRGYQTVVDGSNADDQGDYRPGLQAGRKLGVRSPLQEVGLTKSEIRELSRQLGLPTWDKPAMACLASRIPYGQRITPEKLLRVNAAERFLRSLGFNQLRVRCHDDIARLEVAPTDIPRLLSDEHRGMIISRLKELGFTYVAADLEGYRSGSMNERLSEPRGAKN